MNQSFHTHSLHTLNTPPSDQDTKMQCLSTLSDGDILVLIENATYWALPVHRQALPSDLKVYALRVDLDARGIIPDTSVQAISDADFVDLTLCYERIISWF